MNRLNRLSKPKIEFLPLVDVMFLLLAVSILSMAQMTSVKGIAVGLAKAKSSDQIANQRSLLYLSVDKSGAIYWDDKKINRSALSQRLHDLSVLKNRKVILQADGDAKHKSVVQVLDMVRDHGVTEVVVAVKPI